MDHGRSVHAREMTEAAGRERRQKNLAEQANFARGYSPLYSTMLDLIGRWLNDPGGAAERLALPKLVSVCDDLAEFISASQWNSDLEPTLRLGACLHAFVLDGDPRVESLRAYYRTVDGAGDPTDDRFEAVLAESLSALGPELLDQARDWRVRTNETSRGIAWLLPAALVGAEAAYLIELGASAGLNLYAEQRSWTLEWENGDKVRVGRAPEDQFRVLVEGQGVPALGDFARGPEVLGRVGCDTDPVDPGEPATTRVLSACVWGDQSRRLRRLREGLEVHQSAKGGAMGPLAEVRSVVLPDDIVAFLQGALPHNPVAPVISFNTCVTTYFNDVDHRALERRLGEFAKSWSLQHHLPWMWVRFEPARAGDDPAPEPGWCRWRVDLWEGARHHRIELGWAHPHLVRAKLGPGLLALAQLRDPE